MNSILKCYAGLRKNKLSEFRIYLFPERGLGQKGSSENIKGHSEILKGTSEVLKCHSEILKGTSEVLKCHSEILKGRLEVPFSVSKI